MDFLPNPRFQTLKLMLHRCKNISYIFNKESYQNEMSVLLDANERSLPVCNIHDADANIHFYVPDEESFKKHKKSGEDLKVLFIVFLLILVLFLSIFTLNFGVSGWTAGNVLTFVIVVITLLACIKFGKEWTETQTIVNKMMNDGAPCYTKLSEKANVVHCPK